ncbi:hypothetical protein MMB232_02128 [Brevundimonas subvibrioides]|uniref:Outer membrane efflux protein n=2 Tax=Brevundimonas subvibrioides TaxID=74313 RepID=D9QJJ7_BRESC|nr:outer membrane efflux protein [Brevundimonas subvibrioides ATCC 15264]
MVGGEALFLLAGQVFPVLTDAMTKPPETTPAAAEAAPSETARTPEQIAKSERAHRLAKALRDNLRRRKAVRPDRRDS